MLALCIIAQLTIGTAQSDSLDFSRELIAKTNDQLKKSQAKINKLDDSTKELLDDYKSVTRESETLNHAGIIGS